MASSFGFQRRRRDRRAASALSPGIESLSWENIVRAEARLSTPIAHRTVPSPEGYARLTLRLRR